LDEIFRVRATVEVLHDGINVVVDLVCAAKLAGLTTRRESEWLKRRAHNQRDIFQKSWEGMLELSFICLYIVCIHKLSVSMAKVALGVGYFCQHWYKLVVGFCWCEGHGMNIPVLIGCSMQCFKDFLTINLSEMTC
jgi:hypothetical protein